ncbi:hypothetical protein GCK32_020896 [Trichostrongylus colubriformis]|uniref:DUF5641 domain-containing protein n=1 Tax=Trichostrongylus colubriformis TaxID=6319 RepID=A0AAN8IRN3_TRICO
MWELEEIGITDNIANEDENQKVMKDFYDIVEIRNNGIYVRFPWKPNKMEVQDNYKLALSSVVLLQDENSPRTQWKMGVIQELCPGEDDKVRSVNVRTPNGRIVKRSINMLVPLELSTTEENISKETDPEKVKADSQPEHSERRKQPDRRAKKKVTYAECADIIPHNELAQQLTRKVHVIRTQQT